MKKLVSILLSVMLIASAAILAFAENYKVGDVDGNGKVSVLDAKLILRQLAGPAFLDNNAATRADVNGDGYMSLLDAKRILQAVAGLRDLESTADNALIEPSDGEFPYLDPNGPIPSEIQYAYFTASTGEEIEVCTYSPLDGSFCIRVYEEADRVTAEYNVGGNNTWVKCEDCELYLCDGECVDHSYCRWCGYPTDKCRRFIRDMDCIYCGEPVTANTCHHCYEN